MNYLRHFYDEFSGEDHLALYGAKVAANFSKIIKRIRKKESKLLKEASRNPGRARVVLDLPSLPGNFRGSTIGSPNIPARIGRFKVQIGFPNLGGGSLGGVGLKSGREKGSLIRFDYHGAHKKGNHTWRGHGVEYFRGGSGMSHLPQNGSPWLHYHVAS